MKKIKLFLAMWFLTTFLGVCFAQDVIVTKDARKINAKVTEVNIDDIKYKNFDNQDGPTYTMLKSAVSSILYQNGTVETFEAVKVESESKEMNLDFLTAKPSQQTRVQSAQQRRFSYSNMKSDEPLLYEKYKSGKKQKGWGNFFTVAGVGSAVASVFMAAGNRRIGIGVCVLNNKVG
jgi:hypothetical protein